MAAKPTTKRKTVKAAAGRARRPRGTLTVAAVISALRASNGIRSHAAERLKVDRSAITRFIAKHTEIEAIEAEIVDGLVDTAESGLHTLIVQNEFSAIRYYLENKGGRAGYGVKKIELSGRGGGPIELKDMSQFTDDQLAILERAAGLLAGGAQGSDEQS